MKTFGEKLKELRIDKGLTQKKVMLIYHMDKAIWTLIIIIERFL